LSDVDPVLPEQLNDRAQDNWRQLIAIADMCSTELGQTARVAAVAISEEVEDESAAAMALADAAAFVEQKHKVNPKLERIASEELVKHFITLDDRPWSKWRHGEPMTKNSLTKLLKPYVGKTVDIRFADNKVKKGYFISMILEAKARWVDRTTPADPAE